MSKTPKRQRGPQRPPRPNDKGLAEAPTLQVKTSRLQDLQDRARYETTHYRIEHGGKGKAITAQDIVRRLIDDFFDRVSPIPNDSIGAVLRQK